MVVPTHLFMLLHSTSRTLAGFVLEQAGMGRHPQGVCMLGLCRDLRFDGRGQAIDALPRALVEFPFYQLDAEMPLNLENELQDIDRVDLQIAANQWLIVAQLFRGQVPDPQAANDDRLKLFLDVGHGYYSLQYSTRAQRTRPRAEVKPRKPRQTHPIGSRSTALPASKSRTGWPRKCPIFR